MELSLHTDAKDVVNEHKQLHKEGVVFSCVLDFFLMASRVQSLACSQGQERTHVC